MEVSLPSERSIPSAEYEADTIVAWDWKGSIS